MSWASPIHPIFTAATSGPWSTQHPPPSPSDETGNAMATTNPVSSIPIRTMSPSSRPLHPAETPSMDPGALTLFDLPAELRNRIFEFATSRQEKIVVRSRHCSSPPLAQTCTQLRREVLPIFYETNTFHLPLAHHLPNWFPCASPTNFARLNTLHIDLPSSVAFAWSLKHFSLQPIKLLDESDGLGASSSGDREGVVGADRTVVWTSHSRAIASMVTDPRSKVFLSVEDLTGEVRRLEEVERARKAGECLQQQEWLRGCSMDCQRVLEIGGLQACRSETSWD